MANFIINHYHNQYGDLKPQLFIGHQLAGIPNSLSNSLDQFELIADSALNYPNIYPEYGHNQAFIICKSMSPSVAPNPLFF